MEKEFVSYEIALALKELGFDEPCIMCYYGISNADEDKRERLYLSSGMGKVCNSHLIEKENGITAPLYQQAFRWLRETHNIDVDVVRDSEVHYQDETRWIVKASDWNDIRVKDFPIAQLKFPNTSHHTDFKTYDEALAKGLEEALKFIKK